VICTLESLYCKSYTPVFFRKFWKCSLSGDHPYEDVVKKWQSSQKLFSQIWDMNQLRITNLKSTFYISLATQWKPNIQIWKKIARFYLSQQVIKTLQNHFNFIFYFAFQQKTFQWTKWWLLLELDVNQTWFGVLFFSTGKIRSLGI